MRRQARPRRRSLREQERSIRDPSGPGGRNAGRRCRPHATRTRPPPGRPGSRSPGRAGQGWDGWDDGSGGSRLMTEIVEQGTFDPAEFDDELLAAASNLDVGTRLWFENHRIKVWEIRLEPGERGP